MWAAAACIGAVAFMLLYQLFSDDAMPFLLGAYAFTVGKTVEHGWVAD